MAGAGVTKTMKSVFSSELYNVKLISRRWLSSVQGGVKHAKRVEEIEKEVEDQHCCWKPHPRSGIYFPEGQESVMEDVPENAASFKKTCWFRDIEGVDKPNPDDDHNLAELDLSLIHDSEFMNI
ncbi:hypothetical protein LIER_02867 [Lithospermum erythrorhizon]|uniref:Late embryogenesis abundant protein n=1 Tax=Lithospermum erythrorhizon TaxID=34254 RepID=A0AAV3NSI6_LITER